MIVNTMLDRSIHLKIGVISDTHIPRRVKALPEIVLETFKDVTHIIHAGDIMSMEVINKLEELAPVTAVAGNLDSPELYKKLGDKRILSFGNFKIGIFHGHGDKGKTVDRAISCFKDDNVNCIVFGHSHIPYCQYHDDILIFNPGSPTDKRRNKYFSVGLMDIGKTISARLIYFDTEGKIVEKE